MLNGNRFRASDMATLAKLPIPRNRIEMFAIDNKWWNGGLGNKNFSGSLNSICWWLTRIHLNFSGAYVPKFSTTAAKTVCTIKLLCPFMELTDSLYENAQERLAKSFQFEKMYWNNMSLYQKILFQLILFLRELDCLPGEKLHLNNLFEDSLSPLYGKVFDWLLLRLYISVEAKNFHHSTVS